VALLDLDMHYLRISAITVKILNQFHMQIEFVVERARKVHDRESIWEYGATPPGNRRVSRKVHPKGIPRSWRTSRWNELSLVSRVSRDVSTLLTSRSSARNSMESRTTSMNREQNDSHGCEVTEKCYMIYRNDIFSLCSVIFFLN